MLIPKVDVLQARLKRQGSLAIGFTVPFETICSVPKKPYGGSIVVSYVPQISKEGEALLLEWNSFAKWIESLRSQEFLAEELAQAVAHAIHSLVKPESLTIALEIDSSFHLPVVVEVTIP